MPSRIDWGSVAVYHQALRIARARGADVAQLPNWPGVDRPGGLRDLLRRIEPSPDAALAGLRDRLQILLASHEVRP